MVIFAFVILLDVGCILIPIPSHCRTLPSFTTEDVADASFVIVEAAVRVVPQELDMCRHKSAEASRRTIKGLSTSVLRRVVWVV